MTFRRRSGILSSEVRKNLTAREADNKNRKRASKVEKKAAEMRGYFIRARIYGDMYGVDCRLYDADYCGEYFISEDIEYARHEVSARIQYGKRMYTNPAVRFVVVQSVERVS